jgi:hypothetical protein
MSQLHTALGGQCGGDGYSEFAELKILAWLVHDVTLKKVETP